MSAPDQIVNRAPSGTGRIIVLTCAPRQPTVLAAVFRSLRQGDATPQPDPGYEQAAIGLVTSYDYDGPARNHQARSARTGAPTW